MLSPKTQTNLANAKNYFDEHLAVGDYYTEANRISGEWIGAGAAALGLHGAVDQRAFVALCDNLHPQSGERLTLRKKTTRQERTNDGEERTVANRRVFYDFTFSPPKSVSVAALVADDSRIVAAHRAAVTAAVRELERFAAVQVHGKVQAPDRLTGNIVAALFEHETSRALDPHLHTHCIIFNATHDADEGRWKALHNYEMLAAQKFVENVYYHELAGALRGYGYSVVNSARGDFQVAEIPPELCERFSKRHREIDEKTRALLDARPEMSGRNVNDVRENIAHNERSRKLRALPRSELQRLWHGQLGASERVGIAAPSRQHKDGSDPTDRDAAAAVSWAEDHLFDRRSVIREHELWRYALEIARGCAVTLSDVKRETVRRDYIREAQGKLTRRDVLAREWHIVQLAKDGALKYEALGSASAGAAEGLAEDQRAALTRLLASRDFVTLFRGGAGTGKSFVLRRVQEALQRESRVTRVLAPQRQQVLDLAKDGLANTQTVAEFLTTRSMPPRAVVVIDEAGQIGAQQMLDLLKLVEARGGRVILSGDTRQHGPVEASDALRAIERYSGLRAAELNEIRRQDPERAADLSERARIAEYREAVKEASEGALAASFDRLDALGVVAECAPDAARDALVGAYVALAERKESAIVVSQTWTEIDEINDRIRSGLRGRKLLSEEERTITAHKPLDLTTAQKQDARFYPEDHVIVFNRRVARCQRGDVGRLHAMTSKGAVLDTGHSLHWLKLAQLDAISVCKPQPLALSRGDRLQLKANAVAADGAKLANGELVTVAKIKAGGEIVLADGRTLPASYRQFVRGYAVTSYGSQGKTVDHVLFADSAIRAATNAQQWYVSISRGRKSVRIFTPDKTELRTNVARSGDRPLAMDLKPIRNRRDALRYILLRGARRGRAFARAICMAFAAKRRGPARTIKPSITP